MSVVPRCRISLASRRRNVNDHLFDAVEGMMMELKVGPTWVITSLHTPARFKELT